MGHVTHIVCYGDSITEGPNGTNVADGGAGNWLEQWSFRLADTSNDAQRIISPGFRSLWLSGALTLGDSFASSTDEWTVDTAAHWTSVSTSAAYNKAPHGQMWAGQNGASAIATWQRRNGVGPVVGFDLLYVDGPLNSTTGNWQYQIDGGAWTNMGQSPSGDGNLHKFYVNSAVVSTVSIRQFDGSASAAIYVVGIIPYYADPRTANGLVFHNLGRFGFWLEITTNILNGNTGADPLAFFDQCVLGSNAVAHTPVLSTLEFVNDMAVVHDATKWSTDLGRYWTRYSSMNIPLILFQMYELNGNNGSLQSDYRTNSATFAAGKNVTLLNLFAAYQNLGFGGVGVQGPAITGVILSDGTHPNVFGCHDIASRLADLTRTSFFPSIYQPSWTYTTPSFTTGKTANGTAALGGEIVQIYTATDTVGITDTISDHAVKARTLSNTVGVTDTASAKVAKLRAAVDAVGIADTLAGISAKSRAVTDTVAIGGTIADHLVFARSNSDTVGIVDLLQSPGRFRFSDPVGVADALVALVGRTSVLFEAVGVAEPVTDRLTFRRSVTDVVGLTDTVRAVGETARFADAVGLTDAATAQVEIARAIADIVRITDTLARSAIFARNISEIVGLADRLVLSTAGGRLLETVGLSDSVLVRLITRQVIFTPTVVSVRASQNVAAVRASLNTATVI